MKKFQILLFVILPSILLGWALGYLRLPFIQGNSAYFLGLLTGFVVVFFILLLLWFKNDFNKEVGSNLKSNTRMIILLSLLSISLLFVFFWNYQLIKSNQELLSLTKEQGTLLNTQAEVIHSSKKDAQYQLVYEFINKLEEELDSIDSRSLSEQTITKLSLLSVALEPYPSFTTDSFSVMELSPGRAQLLKMLINLKIDSASFSEVRRKVSFSAADLEGADLKGVNLSEIDLSGANLKAANLIGANLYKANISGANLWNASLNKSNLREVDGSNANLSWAEVNQADIRKANFSGVTMLNAKLRGSQMSDAIFKWSDLTASMFNESDLNGVDIFSATLNRTDFRNANLENSRIRNSRWKDANLDGVNLSNAAVQEDWLKTLESFNIVGMEQIKNNYRIEADSSNRFKNEKFFLKKMN